MKAGKAAVAFILVTVTLDMLTVGFIRPVLPKLILDFLGGNMNSAARLEWRIRNRIRPDAVFLFACYRCFVRSDR